MARKPIDITPQMLDEVERLASLGLNEAQIAESIGIGYTTFQRYKSSFGESLKKGRVALRERVSNALLSKMDSGDITSLIFIAKRINLFQPSIATKAPKNIKEAIDEFKTLYTSFASGDINESQADKLMGILEKYIKGLETFEIEERLNALEEAIKNGAKR